MKKKYLYKLYPDITKNEIRFRLENPGLFMTLRVKVFSKERGIYAIVGRKKRETKTSVQSLRFKKSKGWQVGKAKEWITRKYFKNNPPPLKMLKEPVKIYDKILAIYAVKSNGSNFPGEKFCHKFSDKIKASIYGMPDGSLMIKGSKPLWKNFKYEY